MVRLFEDAAGRRGDDRTAETQMIDTSDLSNEAYQAILVEAERFHHNLTIHFGVLADGCDTQTSL